MCVLAERDREPQKTCHDNEVRRDFENPFRRCMEKAAHDDFVNDDECRREDEETGEKSSEMRQKGEQAVELQ